VHSRRRQRLGDLPVAGPVELVWVKRRWFRDQARCSRGTFSEVTDQVPAFARSTARLAHALVTAVVLSGRAVSEAAPAHRVSWWLVQSMLTLAADLIGDPDDVPVRRLGAPLRAVGPRATRRSLGPPSLGAPANRPDPRGRALPPAAAGGGEGQPA
jgi:hypothetical protein